MGGNSGATITFVDNNNNGPRPWEKRNRKTPASSLQFGETNASSNQTSTGNGGGTNTGQASGVSVQQQSGLGGATQVTINTQQTQQNVNGTLVNVQAGNKGVVILNT